MLGLLLVLAHPLFPLGVWALGRLDQWGLAQVQGWSYEAPAIRAEGDFRQGAPGIEEARRLQDEEEAEDAKLSRVSRLSRLGGAGGAGLGAEGLQPVVQGIVHAAIVLAYAVSYKSSVTDKRAPFSVPSDWSLEMGRQFRHGTFAYCEDWTYCMMGCCCGQTRAADTFATAGAASYWCVVGFLAAMLFLQGVAQFLLGALLIPDQPGAQILVGGLFAFFMAGRRKDFRAKLGGEPSLFMDCICYWWCPWCTVIQDARQLDGAQSARVECCCNLRALAARPAGEVVGAPVVMGSVVGAGAVVAPPVMAKVVGSAEQHRNQEQA